MHTTMMEVTCICELLPLNKNLLYRRHYGKGISYLWEDLQR